GAAPRWGNGTGRKMRRGRGINKLRVGARRTWSWIGARGRARSWTMPRRGRPGPARPAAGPRGVSGSGTGCRGGGQAADRSGGGEGRASRSPTHGYEIRRAGHATFSDTRARRHRPADFPTRSPPVSQDLRIALRTLPKRPLFTAAGVATIGLRTAASVTGYRLVDAAVPEPP